MGTIALYVDHIHQMPLFLNDVKSSVVTYQTELLNLHAQLLTISSSVCDVSDVIKAVQASTQIQEQKAASIDSIAQNNDGFIAEVVNIDESVVSLIDQRKSAFYATYAYLMPYYEMSWIGSAASWYISCVEWCRKAWADFCDWLSGPSYPEVKLLEPIDMSELYSIEPEEEETGKSVLQKGGVGAALESGRSTSDEEWNRMIEQSNDVGVETGIDSEGVLILPEPGETITISYGIDKEDKTATVSSWNAWSIEYSVKSCNKKFAGKTCCKRLNYAINNYKSNSTDDDLLMFYLDGYDEPVFAGAMVEGYANIGDIVHVTLDNDYGFNFLILDVKSTSHTSKELKEDDQIQCEWGHGYMSGENMVQLSVCEFITAGNCSIKSAKDGKSGAFLFRRRVVEAQIIDHVEIRDE